MAAFKLHERTHQWFNRSKNLDLNIINTICNVMTEKSLYEQLYFWHLAT